MYATHILTRCALFVLPMPRPPYSEWHLHPVCVLHYICAHCNVFCLACLLLNLLDSQTWYICTKSSRYYVYIRTSHCIQPFVLTAVFVVIGWPTEWQIVRLFATDCPCCSSVEISDPINWHLSASLCVNAIALNGFRTGQSITTAPLAS